MQSSHDNVSTSSSLDQCEPSFVDRARVLQMITGYQVSRALYLVSKLGIPDRLVAAPKTVEDLARETEVHPQALYRILRALAGLRLFSESANRTFFLEPAGRLLLKNVPGSFRALSLIHGEEQYDAWSEILYSVTNGDTGFRRKFGIDFFSYLQKQPGVASVFNDAMTGLTPVRLQDIQSGYSFSNAGLIADIGAGNGSLLVEILKAHPHLKGIIFDQPELASKAEETMRRGHVATRCQVLSGDFFKVVPAGADIYLLSSVLFDWDDNRAETILRNIREATKADAHLLIYEIVMPEGDAFHYSKFFDLNMMVVTGGLVRTEIEHGRLLKQAGFDLVKISWGSFGALIEAHPVM